MRELISLGKAGMIISNEQQLPTIEPGQIQTKSTLVDTDKDGMPDLWEKIIKGLDPGQPDNNGDVDKNGYTNLEDYLNWLAVPHAICKKDLTCDIDLRAFTSGFDFDAIYTIDKVNGCPAQKFELVNIKGLM